VGEEVDPAATRRRTVETVLGVGVALAGATTGLSTKLTWYPLRGWDGFDLVRFGVQEGLPVRTFFAVSDNGGGEDVVDLWVGPGVTLVLAGVLVVLGLVIAVRPGWWRWSRPSAAQVASIVSIASLGLSLWSFDAFRPYGSRGAGPVVWLVASAVATGLAGSLVVLESRSGQHGHTASSGLAIASTLVAVATVGIAGTELAGLASTGYERIGVARYSAALLAFVGLLALTATMALVALARPGRGAGRRALGVVTLAACALGFGFLPYAGAFGGTGVF
jgi:hypothetical protein